MRARLRGLRVLGGPVAIAHVSHRKGYCYAQYEDDDNDETRDIRAKAIVLGVERARVLVSSL